MSCFENLQSRGLIHQCSDEATLAPLINAGEAILYQGFDATAPSLHVGSLFGLVTLRRLQLAGNKIIVLLGGATSLIGDPSGKRVERPLLTAAEVARNTEAIKAQIGRIVDFAGDNPAILVNNADWFASMNLLDFLRQVGKHCPVNAMLNKDSVSSRLASEAGLSFTEFTYQLFQAYDFLHLYREHACHLQVGGSDQWGNITAGTELVRRAVGGQAHALTMPLVTTADGEKMGKTAQGAVWLDDVKTLPYDFYQYWINTDDRDVQRFLAFYTFLSVAEIAALCQADLRHARERLALEVTALVFGIIRAMAVQATSRAAFSGDAANAEGLPEIMLPASLLSSDGLSVIELLVESGLAESRSAARRLILHGGAYVGDQRIIDCSERIPHEVLVGGSMIVRAGKKRLMRVTVGQLGH
jgi:tyrosyl-tRNA synthetase